MIKKTKQCHRCRQEKSTDVFSKNKASVDGYQAACKDCVKIYYWTVPKEVHRDRALKSRYGISLYEYERFRDSQNGACAICNKITKLCVDHCHKFGNVRKLLCHDCNSLLGFSKDNPEILIKAIKYLYDTKNQAPDEQT